MLHSEGQNQPTQIVPASALERQSEQSEQSKSKRGGKRAGAGRKPNYFKRLGIKATDAAQILAHQDVPAMWDFFLRHKNPRIRLDAWKYLHDRAYGKPRQAIDLSGGVAHMVYRDPVLANLSQEELEQLDKLTKKLSTPVANASPDAHQNQIESMPALEAEVVSSEASEANA